MRNSLDEVVITLFDQDGDGILNKEERDKYERLKKYNDKKNNNDQLLSEEEQTLVARLFSAETLLENAAEQEEKLTKVLLGPVKQTMEII